MPINKCEIYTQQGKPCPYEAKTYNHNVGKKVCNRHETVCENRYQEYHKICDKVWDKKCLYNTEYHELNQIVDFAKTCKTQRIDFTNSCCDGQSDEGHSGAILKMENIIEICNHEIKHRDYELEEEQRKQKRKDKKRRNNSKK